MRRWHPILMSGVKVADRINHTSEQPALTVQQAFDLAVQHHNAGDLPEAENIYNQILQADPNQPDALHYLGVIAHQTRNNEKAIELIKIKIQQDKDRLIADFKGSPNVQVLNGRYGPFIQVSPKEGQKINIKIPKNIDPKSLNREDCLSLMEEQRKKKKKTK